MGQSLEWKGKAGVSMRENRKGLLVFLRLK